MSINNERPLVSVIVLSHNCAKFLPEALDGVFHQTYRPMEVIISDDHSSDDSYKVILDTIKNLPKEISRGMRINASCNAQNRGNIGNWQKCCELAKGELYFKFDGDDYSSPIRVEETVNEWLKNGKQAKVLMCQGVRTDITGTKCTGYINPNIDGDLVMGAVAAYAAETYTQFPKIPKCAAYDDQIFTNRGLMLAKPLLIDKIFVKYRTGSGMTTSRQINYRAPAIRILTSEIDAYTQLLNDLASIKWKLSLAEYEKFEKRFSNKVDICKYNLQLWGGKSLAERWCGLLAKFRMLGGASRSDIASILCLLPNALSDRIFAMWQKWRERKAEQKYKGINPDMLVARDLETIH